MDRIKNGRFDFFFRVLSFQFFPLPYTTIARTRTGVPVYKRVLFRFRPQNAMHIKAIFDRKKNIILYRIIIRRYTMNNEWLEKINKS